MSAARCRNTFGVCSRAAPMDSSGGTIDRWTRTIYMVPGPGPAGPDAARVPPSTSACILFAHPHAPTQPQCPRPCIGTFQARFGHGFGEGLTQVIAEDIMADAGHQPVLPRSALRRLHRGHAGRRRGFRTRCDGARLLLRRGGQPEHLNGCALGRDWRAVATARRRPARTRKRARTFDGSRRPYEERLRQIMRQAHQGRLPHSDQERRTV